MEQSTESNKDGKTEEKTQTNNSSKVQIATPNTLIVDHNCWQQEKPLLHHIAFILYDFYYGCRCTQSLSFRVCFCFLIEISLAFCANYDFVCTAPSTIKRSIHEAKLQFQMRSDRKKRIYKCIDKEAFCTVSNGKHNFAFMMCEHIFVCVFLHTCELSCLQFATKIHCNRYRLRWTASVCFIVSILHLANSSLHMMAVTVLFLFVWNFITCMFTVYAWGYVRGANIQNNTIAEEKKEETKSKTKSNKNRLAMMAKKCTKI